MTFVIKTGVFSQTLKPNPFWLFMMVTCNKWVEMIWVW